MRPHIICHMASSIDGRIDGSTLASLMGKGEYERTGASLRGDAWICGRTTMQMHFAEKRRFTPRSRKQAASPSVHVATRARSYAIAVDTRGTLPWAGNDIDGDHLLCITSERVTLEYLADLRKKKISYIVTGGIGVDLGKAVRLLRKHFGIKRLLLEGGGHINGGFMQARLIDEISLLLIPGIDGRAGVPTVFDGVGPEHTHAVPLRLTSVTKRKNGTLWLRYTVLNKK
ncbi:MAG: RibD family protein [Ignavibacteriae bacterium]|nr:RibD family protein [Ignavibacteriota bacterium]